MVNAPPDFLKPLGGEEINSLVSATGPLISASTSTPIKVPPKAGLGWAKERQKWIISFRLGVEGDLISWINTRFTMLRFIDEIVPAFIVEFINAEWVNCTSNNQRTIPTTNRISRNDRTDMRAFHHFICFIRRKPYATATDRNYFDLIWEKQQLRLLKAYNDKQIMQTIWIFSE